jgi:hypothetical protein
VSIGTRNSAVWILLPVKQCTSGYYLRIWLLTRSICPMITISKSKVPRAKDQGIWYMCLLFRLSLPFVIELPLLRSNNLNRKTVSSPSSTCKNYAPWTLLSLQIENSFTRDISTTHLILLRCFCQTCVTAQSTATVNQTASKLIPCFQVYTRKQQK